MIKVRRRETMNILEAKNISRVYGQKNLFTALHKTNLEIKQGTFTAIVGRSGSGKSTLLHILGGLDEPTTGKVTLEGQDIFSLSDKHNAKLRRTRIGFVFQFYNLISELTVYENIVLPIHLDGKKEDRAYIEELIEVLGLKSKQDALPQTLSGGQQQRVAIARALANKPAVLLADEPTGNLDKKSGDEVMELLRLTRHHFNQTIILVTHDQALAHMADRIITIEDGKIVSDEHV